MSIQESDKIRFDCFVFEMQSNLSSHHNYKDIDKKPDLNSKFLKPQFLVHNFATIDAVSDN